LWFYEQAKRVSEEKNIHRELIPIMDYLFRYDRGAFWMGEHSLSFLHIPSNRISKFLFDSLLHTRKMYKALHTVNITQNYFIQDFYCPFYKSLDFLKYIEDRLAIFPLWLCPIKTSKTPQKLSPHFLKGDMLLDIGIWGQTKKYLIDTTKANRDFEEYSYKNGARKMLYAEAYYTQEEFWKTYDYKWYKKLRKKYNAEKVFPDVWQKVYVGKKYKVNLWKAFLKAVWKLLGF